MIVRTPGSTPVQQSPGAARNPRQRLVGVVLDINDAASGPRWLDGPTANVLLLRTYHEMHGVVIPAKFSGRGGNHDFRLPDVTDPEVVAALRAAVPSNRPRLIDASNTLGQRWGSRVIIGWMEGTIPIIDGYLLNPATPANRLVATAAAGTPASVQDQMAHAASVAPTTASTPTDDRLPFAVATTIARVPGALAFDPVLRDLYIAGYREGYSQQMNNMLTDPLNPGRYEVDKSISLDPEGYASDTGHKDGFRRAESDYWQQQGVWGR